MILLFPCILTQKQLYLEFVLWCLLYLLFGLNCCLLSFFLNAFSCQKSSCKFANYAKANYFKFTHHSSQVTVIDYCSTGVVCGGGNPVGHLPIVLISKALVPSVQHLCFSKRLDIHLTPDKTASNFRDFAHTLLTTPAVLCRIKCNQLILGFVVLTLVSV